MVVVVWLRLCEAWPAIKMIEHKFLSTGRRVPLWDQARA